MTNLLHLAIRLLALPGRLLIRTIDDLKRANGVPPLGGFLRGCVHAFIWFVGFVLVVSVAIPPAPTPTPTRSAASPVPTTRPSYTPPPRPTGILKPMPTRASAEAGLEKLSGAIVARVIDGDTFELTDGRKVRVLGIDSCESDTPGGDLATAKARELLVGSVGLRAEPGVDEDGFGRLLRYVQTSSGDFGQAMVGYDHTGVYQGDNDASDGYLETLYAHDLDHAASPPSGRECGSHPSPAPSPPVDNDDSGSAYYPSCKAARAAGAAPLYVGEPGYRGGLDRDKDGTACE